MFDLAPAQLSNVLKIAQLSPKAMGLVTPEIQSTQILTVPEKAKLGNDTIDFLFHSR